MPNAATATARWVLIGLAAVALVAGIGLLWVGSADTGRPPAAAGEQHPSPEHSEQSGQSGQPRLRATTVQIPALDLDRRLLSLGLTDDGALEVPTMTQAHLPGWYRQSVAPGKVGPTVIAGHVDSTTGPAVFYELSTLERGDTVRVGRSDGHTATYRVTRVEAFDKDDFPTQQVYGRIRHAGLRLITCSGAYLSDQGGYQANTVVFGRLIRK